MRTLVRPDSIPAKSSATQQWTPGASHGSLCPVNQGDSADTANAVAEATKNVSPADRSMADQWSLGWGPSG